MPRPVATVFLLGAFALLLAVLGSALGPMYTVGTVVMQHAVKRHQLGTATGTLNMSTSGTRKRAGALQPPHHIG